MDFFYKGEVSPTDTYYRLKRTGKIKSHSRAGKFEVEIVRKGIDSRAGKRRGRLKVFPKNKDRAELKCFLNGLYHNMEIF